MLKVFLVIPSLGVGGAERLTLDLANGLDKTRYNVTIISLYNSQSKDFDTNNIDAVEIIRLNKSKGLDIGLIFGLTKLFLKNKPDIVHTHLYAAPYTLLPAVLSRCKVRLHTIHSTTKHELLPKKRLIMKVLYRYFKYRPVAITDILVEDIRQCYNLPLNNILLVRNGIDTKNFARKKTNKIKNKFITIVTTGRLTEIKNHKLLLQSFRFALDKNPNLRLKIAGEGPERSHLENIINSKGLSESVELLGICTDVSRLLDEADIYISTSTTEGLPLSVLEAMAKSLPIIATPAGGTVDIVSDNNGYLASYEPIDISNTIIKFASDKDLRNACGKKSCEIVRNYYDVNNMVKGYDEIYTKLTQ